MRNLFLLLLIALTACTKPAEDVLPEYERVNVTRIVVNQYPEMNNGDHWDEESWNWSAPDLYTRITDEYGIIYAQPSYVSDVAIDDLPQTLHTASMYPLFPLDREMVVELRDEDEGGSELVGRLVFDPSTVPMDAYGLAQLTYSENGVTLTLDLRFSEE